MASAHQEEVGLGYPGIQPSSSDVLEAATGGEESTGGLYVVTAAQPSIVTHARVAHFMAPDQLSLLLVRLNRIEIYQVHDEVEGPRGTILSACANLPVFGRIAALEVLPGAAFNERVVARDSIQSGHVDATHESEQHAGSVVQGKTLRSASKRARTSARVRLESSLKVSPERVRHQQPESKTSGKDTDAVFILTERLEFAVIKFDPVLQGVATLVAGSLASKLGRRCPLGEFVAVDPDMRCLVVYAYDGLLKVIPGSLMSEAFEVRLDVVQVQSMTFLHGTEQPTLAIIHTDYLHNRHLVSYEILLSTQDVRDGPFSQQYLDGSAELIISIPSPSSGSSDGSQSCSFVITGDTSLALYPGRTGVAKQVIHFHSDQFAPMRCFCRINEVCRSRKASVAETALQNRFEAGLDMLTATGYHNHYLLGDREGFLYVLSVGSDVGMRLECVCDTSIASAVAYLGWGYVFVGSTLGDSQLLRLVPSQTESPVQVQTTLSSASLSSPERKGTQSDQTECQLWFGEVVQNYTNIGPIQDLLVTDEDFFSDGHMIACSGVSRMGSLRIIRNGIGFIEHATVELEGVKALFTLSSLDNPEYDEFLVVSFTAETRVLRLTESDELAEVEALALEEATLLAQRPTTGNSAIWVTPSRVSVIDLTLSEEPTVIWSPSHRDRITNAVMDEVHGLLLVSTSGAHLYIIRLSGKVLEVVGDLALPAEAACMCAAHGIVALGTWAESQIRLYRPHKVAENRWELNCIREEALPSQSVPRSVLLSYLDDQGALPAEQSGKSHLYLLVAVGDGRLFTFTVLPSRRVEREPVKLSDDDDDDDELCLQHPRQLRLGSRPAALNILQLHGMRYVFAACGRAAVIHAHHGTLLCGNVNLRDVTRAVRFHTRSFPDSIALATEHGLLLGAIEHIQQLHIRRHDLHEQPRRIARLRGCLCLLTVSAMLGEERHHVRLLNDETLESITSYDLSTNEHGLSLIAVPERDIFVVGTAYVLPSEMEPSRGRILVFGRDDLLLLHETNTPGAVYTMSSMAGLEDSMTGSPVTPARFLTAGVNNVVILYAWGQSLHGDDSNLREVTRHLGHVLALRLEARGNLLLVGDLMKSVCLLQLVAAENGTSDRAMPRLKAVAWDYETAWITACTFLNLDQYLAADNSYNLICLRRNPNETRAEFRHALTREGAFHLGDLVNVFRVGKLVTEASGREAPNESNDAEPFPHRFGTPEWVSDTAVRHNFWCNWRHCASRSSAVSNIVAFGESAEILRRGPARPSTRHRG
ncbi:DNA damage-binding protein 1 [Cyanidiococcus yangmingshanensis]|uniref:DNA damage-binding protein 1 n=1 Tax=Cyanidiococcus yangmingshanensis TaxID=2690220 RepID=A0A7J7IGE5_9RHOD|nr:DNA damage-binding protein 1 [Cyanidiococcus yangmingshanensis]